MNPRVVWLSVTLALTILSAPRGADSQPRVPRIGVVYQGGPSGYGTVEGLRAGLKDLGLEEGKQFTLEIRDLTGTSSERRST